MSDCAYFDAGRCRSCSEIERPYAAQLAAKERHCRDLLTAFEPIQWLPSVTSPTRCFRNKAKMVVSGSIDTPLLGIVDAHGEGVDLVDCLLYPPALQASFAPLVDYIRRARIAPYDIAGRRGELKYLLITLAEHSGQLMVRFVLRSQEAVGRMRRELASLQAALPGLVVVSVNLQPEHKAVLEGEQELLLTDNDQLTMRLNGLPLHLKPKCFFQTNTEVAAALYRLARDWIDEAAPARVWDLYCGVGGFALHAARPDRDVLGIEISREAIASAEQSRLELGADRVSFRSGDATAFALAEARLPDMLVVNPPRRGIGADLCRRIEHSDVRWLLYSSCNADSLADDLARMPSLQPQRACLLDMFPHTRHHELLLLAERRPGLVSDAGRP